jgi:hypothetical protein
MLGAGEIVLLVVAVLAVSFLGSLLIGLFCAGIQDAEREVEHRIEANYPGRAIRGGISGSPCGEQMMALTQQQKRAYDFVRAAIATSGGVGPTHQEIADHLGLKSKSGTHRIIRALEAKGYLLCLKKRARAMEILDTARPCPHCFHPSGSAACLAAAAKPITYSATPKHEMAA